MNAGHYKQTQHNAVMEAVTNIVVSLLFLNKMGITGVAVGTLSGMIVRTIMDVRYLSNNIVYRSPMLFIKSLITNAVIFVTCSFIGNLIPISITGWGSWILTASIVFTITILIAVLVYSVTYSKQMNEVISRMELLVRR